MEGFLEAVSHIGTGTYWLSLFVAISVGTIVGFIPGVGATLATAIMLPMVLYLVEEPAIGIVLLAMVASLNNTLSSIPAVLVGLPDSETQVTYLEGHQLARQGKAAHTLGAIYSVSAMGGIIGAIALALLIPVIKPVILEFSYAEVAMLALFGIAMISLLARGSMSKGFLAGALGLLLGTVGVDPVSGTARYTFDQMELWAGLPVVTVILGFFAIPELVDLTMTRQPVARSGAVVSQKEVFRGAVHGLKRWPMVIRQSLFGTFLGAIPGIGGGVIDWLAYAFGISLTKDKKKHNFGKGSLEGVLFAESANNSKAGGQALPTLVLGIPGSSSWAIIAVAMLAYGFAPGPSMLEQNQDVTMLMVLTLAIGNVIVAAIGLFATNWLARVTLIPYPMVAFLVLALVMLAAYMDLAYWMVYFILFGFSVLGLLMKRYGWARPPLLLGFILGPIVEQNLLSAASIYGWAGLLTRPLAIGLLVLIVLTVGILLRLGNAKDKEHVPLPDEATVAVGAGGASEEVPTWVVEASSTGGFGGEGSDAVDGVRSTDTGPAGEGSEPSRDSVWKRLTQPANLAPLAFLAIGATALILSASFPAGARTLPVATAGLVCVLAVYTLVRQTLKHKDEPAAHAVMDLGMASSGMEGASRAAGMLVLLFLMFALLAGLAGLDWAAVALATVGPYVFLKGRQGVIAAAISGVFVWLFSAYVVADLVGLIWPVPFLWPLLGLG